MLHFETHTLWSGAKVSAFCFLGRIALFSNWVREVQGNDLHLLGTIEDFVREKTLHQDAEPAKRNPGHYRNSADDSGQHDHADNQVGGIVPASEVGILVPNNI